VPGSPSRAVRTARDNARARALGYASYYDFRLHDSGRIPPGVDVTAQMRRSGRGHASAADFERDLRAGSLVMATELVRGRGGRYTRIQLTVVDLDGRERRYVLRGRALTARMLRRLADATVDAGAILSPSKSLNVRSLASDVEEGDE
jgi:hypothetical protein